MNGEEHGADLGGCGQGHHVEGRREPLNLFFQSLCSVHLNRERLRPPGWAALATARPP
jgi:hypothetical protein